MIKYLLLEDADDFKTWWGDESWSGANDRYSDYMKLNDDRQNEIADYGFQALTCDDSPIEETTINDYIWFDDDFNDLLNKLCDEQTAEENEDEKHEQFIKD